VLPAISGDATSVGPACYKRSREMLEVTSQKYQNKENEFLFFQILEPTKTFIKYSWIHSEHA
jgi:hypothetical protein